MGVARVITSFPSPLMAFSFDAISSSCALTMISPSQLGASSDYQLAGLMRSVRVDVIDAELDVECRIVTVSRFEMRLDSGVEGIVRRLDQHRDAESA